jgi:ketol-acid reductoisomerase
LKIIEGSGQREVGDMEEREVKTTKTHEIMEKPLPDILDGISSSIELAEKAAADARVAADEARLAGEKAAEHVMKRIRKLFLRMAKDITEELKEMEK